MYLRKLFTMVSIIFRLLFVILSNFYCIPTYLTWIVILHPFKSTFPHIYDVIEGTLYSWMLKIVSSWIWLGNVKVEEAGDNLKELADEKCLVICNHQSTSDVPLLMHFLNTQADVAGKTSWIMDILFKHSHFGWVSQFHHDHFIRQGRDTRTDELKSLNNFLVKDFSTLNRKWLILFPEGGFLYKRLEISQSYASKHGFIHLDYSTLPRIGALEVVLNTLTTESANRDLKNSNPISTDEQKIKSDDTNKNVTQEPLLNDMRTITEEHLKIKWIIDLTICYPQGNAISLFDLVTRQPIFQLPLKINILCRKYPISEVHGMTTNQLQTWLFNKWAEKDEMLRRYYESGGAYFPIDNSQNLPVSNGIHRPTFELPKLENKSKDSSLMKDSALITKDKFDNMVEKTARPISVNLMYLALLHCFFLASSYFHFRVATTLTSYLSWIPEIFV